MYIYIVIPFCAPNKLKLGREIEYTHISVLQTNHNDNLAIHDKNTGEKKNQASNECKGSNMCSVFVTEIKEPNYSIFRMDWLEYYIRFFSSNLASYRSLLIVKK